MKPAPDLTFDSEHHVYRIGERVIPSVTQILRRADMRIDENGVITEAFDFVPRELLDRARLFGQHVHSATDLHDRGELNEDTLDAALVPYLEAYKLFLSETGFKVTASEQRVYHARFKYAGTLDTRGLWKGTTWVLDKKSGAVPRSVGPQTAAYQMACAEKPRRRLCLKLMPHRYQLIGCEDPNDWSIFVSAMNLHHFTTKAFTHGHSDTCVPA